MITMIRKGFLVFFMIFWSFSYAIETHTKEGITTLGEFLTACKEAADSTPSLTINAKIPGKIIEIKKTKFEVRYFSFEDTKGDLPKEMTFLQYAEKNSLLGMKSVVMEPLPGIYFECFDFRRRNLNDGVYFSMALRKL